MGGAAIPTSLKWIGLIVIYFFCLFLILGVVRTSVKSVEYADFDFGSLTEQCGLPRAFYYQNGSYELSDVLVNAEYKNAVCGLSCEHSIGVTSNETCSAITGCTWEVISTTSFFDSVNYNICRLGNIFSGMQGWLGGQLSDCTLGLGNLYSCTGDINASYYGINTTHNIFPSLPFGFADYAAQCEYYQTSTDDDGGVYNNICSDPAVINDEEICSMLGCSWLSRNIVVNMKKEDLKISKSVLTNTMSGIWDLVKLRYEFFGTTEDYQIDSDPSDTTSHTNNVWLNGILSFILFYLPLLLLLGALYGLVPII